ncbi:uncharacterized protein [Gossypium hirsutum]|uniref:Uncharacterized protein isoform X2 n=1 Tax=Gossypium hirsutum TaxID=3635 RepID=A0ABM3AL87_GOSHI|nr:uncharacterized protein LOC107915356 isoform X2 [Gossypium hirsutum]
MHLSAAINSFKSSNRISWKTTGKLQQTLAGCIELSGKTRQSGKVSKTDTRFRPSSICFRLWKLKASTIVEFRFKVSILRILRSRKATFPVRYCWIIKCMILHLHGTNIYSIVRSLQDNFGAS